MTEPSESEVYVQPEGSTTFAWASVTFHHIRGKRKGLRPTATSAYFLREERIGRHRSVIQRCVSRDDNELGTSRNLRTAAYQAQESASITHRTIVYR